MKAVRLGCSLLRIIRVLVVFSFFVFLDAVRRLFSRRPKIPYLSNNFAPVHKELTVEDLPVTGSVPADIDGEYVRNGPNPRFDFEQGSYYHWFDGDGMLHGVRIKDGKATYVNKWVRTQRFNEEQKAGKRIHARLGDIVSPFGFLGMIASAFINQARGLRGRGTANTSVEYHDGRFLALVESDAPYHVKLPLLETVGRYTYDGKLKSSFTAHPKVDRRTGEMIFFGYNINKTPYVQYSTVDRDGNLTRTFPIDIDVPVMMHDFAISERYSVLMVFPFTFRPNRLLNGESPFAFERNRRSRFGIFPRHAKSQKEIRWFESRACYAFHTVNCWEEGDEVVLFACRSKGTGALGLVSDKKALYFDDDSVPYLYQWRFDMSTGQVREGQCSDHSVEFPRVNDGHVGYKTRYAYCARVQERMGGQSGVPLFDGLIKYDLSKMEPGKDVAEAKSGGNADDCDDEEDDIVALMKKRNDRRAASSSAKGKELAKDSTESGREEVLMLGDGTYGGEWAFVPRARSEGEGGERSEDDGYLVSFVYDEKRKASELWIVDAANVSAGPVARIAMPQRVPYGFHGKWMNAHQIAQQRATTSNM